MVAAELAERETEHSELGSIGDILTSSTEAHSKVCGHMPPQIF
jgi:hypothetical protein